MPSSDGATGDRVRAARVRAGWSQAELATATGLSGGYISLLESGRRRPAAATLLTLADALGVSTTYLEGAAAAEDTVAAVALQQADEALDAGRPQLAAQVLGSLRLRDESQAARLPMLRTLAQAHDAAGRTDDAVSTLRQALVAAHTVGDPTTIAEVAMWLVGSLLDTGNRGEALTVGTDALAQVEDSGIAGSDAHLRLGSTLVWAMYENGDPTWATYEASRLVDLARARGSALGLGSVLWNAAWLAHNLGEPDTGIATGWAALEALVEAGADKDAARMRYDQAHMLLTSHEPDAAAALDLLRSAAPVLHVHGSPLENARVQVALARAHHLRGFHALAADLLAAVVDMLPDPSVERADAYVLAADITAADKGDPSDQARRAQEQLMALTPSRRVAQLWTDLGERAYAAGDETVALTCYEHAGDAIGLSRRT